MELQARVSAGAALLDQQADGWAKRINPFTLNMSSLIYCILGQLYRDFGIGVGRLSLETADGRYGAGGTAADYGFTISLQECDEVRRRVGVEGFVSQDTIWDDLKTFWLAEIGKRVKAA